MMQSADHITTTVLPAESAQIQSGQGRGDAKSMCGDHVRCLQDRKTILDMHEESGYTASVYISIILACYVIGLIILLIHYVKQKYGQVNLYDIYLEVCPSRWTGIDPIPDPHTVQDDEEDDDADVEMFTRKSTTGTSTNFSMFKSRLDFFSYSERSRNGNGEKRKSQSGLCRGWMSQSVDERAWKSSAVDASREGRDRRRRMKRQSSKSRNSSEKSNSLSSSHDNDLTSPSYVKISPVMISVPIHEEMEFVSTAPNASMLELSIPLTTSTNPSEGRLHAQAQSNSAEDDKSLCIDLASGNASKNESRKILTKETIL